MTSLMKSATDVISDPAYTEILIVNTDKKIKLNINKIAELNLRNAKFLFKEFCYYLLNYSNPELWNKYASNVRNHVHHSDTTYFHDLCCELASENQKPYLVNDGGFGEGLGFSYKTVLSAVLTARYGELDLTEFFDFNKNFESLENIAVFGSSSSPFMWDLSFLMLILQHYDEVKLKRAISDITK